MADNTTINPGTGGDVISTDDLTTLNGGAVSGFKVQRMKVGFGSDATLRDVDANNGLPITGGQAAAGSTSWTSATSVNTANTINVTGFNTISIACVAGSTLTGGVLTFEVSPDGTNWFPITVARIDSFTVENTHTLVASTNRAWSTSVDGFVSFRVRLSTAITGTGTVAIILIPQTFAIEPIVNVGQLNPANLAANIGLINGVAPLMGGGNTGTGSPRVTIATDNPSNTNPFLVRQQAATTSSGLLIAKLLSAASTNSTLVLTGARALYGWTLANTSTGWRYVRIFNKATAPTSGTDSPAMVIPLPPGGGSNIPKDGVNIPLSLGLGYTITGAAADLDNTAVAANDVVGTLWYV